MRFIDLPAGNSKAIIRGRKNVRSRDGTISPMINLPVGGRNCSMTMVDGGNALVLDLKMARTATAAGGVQEWNWQYKSLAG